ncbi:major facilitator superfamily domain, general substrate transporter [Trichoderma arundinaceum]|uniref:Major facilitator superfamily domain, general substrate transporter n=1 Tax=Trichoderma arundinaceum TaxID=490622 RepID=A0A395NK34_TRIAR|nr:major facilitator superfamily domain, general substrate transporter [Trichoderma arundinaceum]
MSETLPSCEEDSGFDSPPEGAIAISQNDGHDDEKQDFDTGVKAWLQVLGSFFLYFNSWGIINAFGVFETYYEQRILSHVSPSSIAWIGSVQSALLMVVGVISGPLFDAGYFYALLPTGTFLVVLGMMMTSLSTKYYQIMLAQGICVGIGAGFLFIPSVALLPQYFQRRRALANGIAASGSSIGGVLFPIMFRQLETKIGFPWATRTIGLLSLATCAISIGVMRLRFQTQEKRALLQLSAFREAQYSLFCLACFLGFLGFYNFLVYVQPFAIETRIVDADLGFYLVAILNAASTFGRFGPNFVADYTGSLNILFPALTITAILAYCWAAVNSTSGIIALSALYGFFSGGFVSLIPVVMMTITQDLRQLGTRLGMCFALESIGLLIGTPIGGTILHQTGSYLGVQLFCGTCLAACAVILFSVRLLRSGPTLMYKT